MGCARIHIISFHLSMKGGEREREDDFAGYTRISPRSRAKIHESKERAHTHPLFIHLEGLCISM